MGGNGVSFLLFVYKIGEIIVASSDNRIGLVVWDLACGIKCSGFKC